MASSKLQDSSNATLQTVSYDIAKLQDEKLLSFELQYRNVEKLQIARQESCQVAGCNIVILLICEYQDKNFDKMRIARDEHS